MLIQTKFLSLANPSNPPSSIDVWPLSHSQSVPLLTASFAYDLFQIAIALAANIGGQSSPISSPQNLITLQAMDPPLDWAHWFAVALPVSFVSIILIWLMLLVSYRPSHLPSGEGYLEIKSIRPTREGFTAKQWWVTLVCLVTIGLWCVEKGIEEYVGDMGIIAIIPIVAFFGTGVLKKVGKRTVFSSLCPDKRVVCRMILNSSFGLSFSWRWEVSHSEKA